MGTQIGLVFYTSDRQKADTLAQLAFDRIDALNQTLSDYVDSSEINRLNKTPFQKVRVSRDFYRLLESSLEYRRLTEGAFDITLGPLIALWKTARASGTLPAEVDIQDALQRSGYSNLELFGQDTVRLKRAGMQLNVGGIGKGYAADEVILLLKEHGVTMALVDMGGDITVGDPPPNKAYWTLGFTHATKNGESVFRKVKLRNQAVATSGDLYQHMLVEGKKYSHIIDPRTGLALSNQTQVTVIAPNGTMADAMASAFSVLGILQAEKVVQQVPGLEAFMVVELQGAYRQWNSEGFSKFFLEE
ncbi:FAD:protein FMN transferase [Flagellimonas amoyensis]|uniref:FAD:protein FMN transferase n=1 Tax=Flagellimonas amoyensis TaxID=2169401 RepID=UPI00131EDC1E|nr:FAD:protein FMN transferase [Allomuricauda amoyensis]